MDNSNREAMFTALISIKHKVSMEITTWTCEKPALCKAFLMQNDIYVGHSNEQTKTCWL